MKQTINKKWLSTYEAKNFVEIVNNYAKGEATKLFEQEKAGEELFPSVEQKAANLLYYVIKGHPFTDGNKRIGAYLFVLFLHKNGILYKANHQAKINDNALVSLALLAATSAPEQKDIIIKLVMNMLVERANNT